MNHLGEFRIGEDILLALDAVTGDPTTVDTSIAEMRPVTLMGGSFIFTDGGVMTPVGMTFRTASGAIPAGWDLQVAASVTVGLAAGFYGIDASFGIGSGVEITDSTAIIKLTQAATSGVSLPPPAPTVTAISPVSGSTLGGTSVTISGTHFTGATSVTIGGAAATGVTVVNDTSITATTPAGTTGTASVLVTTPSGTNAPNSIYSYVVIPAIYNSAALATYRTARAARASAPCNIICVGDSWTQGYNAFAFGDHWVDKLAVNMRSAFPTTGATGVNGSTFWQAQNQAYYGGFGGVVAWTSVIGTGGALNYAEGMGSQEVVLSSAGNGYRYTFTGTSFDLYYKAGLAVPAGVANISIDSGTATLLDNQAAGTTPAAWNSGALSYGTHTIDITFSSGTDFRYTGFMFYNGDEGKGIRTINSGQSGAVSSETKFYAQYYLDGYFKVPPASLCIIGLTINDYNAQTDLATFKSNIIAGIADARNSATDSSLPILLIGYNQPGNMGALTIPYASYVAKLKEIADADALVAVLDLQAYVPVCATTPATPRDPIGFWDTDYLHPTSSGHTLLATLIADALGQ